MIILIIVGIIIGVIFTYIQNKIIKRIKSNKKLSPIIKKTENEIKKVENKVKEVISKDKLLDGIRINKGILWIKDLLSIFNFRKILIYFFIIGIVYGVGIYKGKQGKAINFNLEGKNVMIKLNNHYMHFLPNGTAVILDKDKKTVLKTIAVKDIPGLRNALKPFGFIFKPIGILGYGVGSKNKFEVGAGFAFLKYFKERLEAFITNAGVYIGISRKISSNSALGIGIGKGYKASNRIIIYYRWVF